MKSISPEAGQPMMVMLVPSAHHAGQRPGPRGSDMLDSMRPYGKLSRLFAELSRAEVQLPL